MLLKDVDEPMNSEGTRAEALEVDVAELLEVGREGIITFTDRSHGHPRSLCSDQETPDVVLVHHVGVVVASVHDEPVVVDGRPELRVLTARAHPS